MAKERLINTRFWNDGWVRKINPLDRYLFIYLLTNEYTNISGIYELPISTMAFGCGLDERDLQKTMIPRLEPKVFYKNGWVILINFLKYQRTKSIKIQKGIAIALKNAPLSIIKFAKSKGYGYDMDMIWKSYHILQSESESEFKYKKNDFSNEKSLLSLKKKKMKKNSFNYKESNHSDSYEDFIDLETGQIEKQKKREPINKNVWKVVDRFGDLCEKHIGKRPIRDMKSYFVVLNASKHLKSGKNFETLFTDWFSSGKANEDLIQITRALSNNNINKIKVNYDLKN